MAYIGHSPSTGEDNNFKILDDISSYTLTFDGSDSSVVSTSDETIYSYNHRFVQGQRVRYTNGGGGDINGLTNNSYYFIIKHDHNHIKLATSASNATDGTAVNITAVGSGSSHTLNVAFDGVNTKFKATHTTGQKARITRGAQLVLSVNGVIQQPHDSSSPSTGFGFDLDGTIVFSQAPQSTDAFWGHILTNNNVTFDISDNTVDHFTGNGSTSSFTLSKSPPNNENILVTIDGVVQYPNDSAGNIRSYATVANVINFTTAPGTGTQIEVRHIGFAGAVTGAGGGGVTGFYGRTGNVTLVNTDNIAVNNANISGNAIVTGDLTVNGTTTTLDTNLMGVDRIEVLDSSSNVAVAITQSGDGDILNLYDGSSEVFSVTDGGITRVKKGVQLIPQTSNLFATDGALSYYATNNAVYLNGAGNNGQLRLNATGSNNDRTSINLCGQSVSNAQDAIVFKTATNERFRINAAGNIKVQDDVQLQFGGVAYTSASEFQIYHSSLENHVGLTTHPLIISSTGGERMRIHNDYVVSIGNTNISSLTQPARLRIQGSYVNNVGPFGILEFKNRENSGNATASIRANRDAVSGGNYSAGLTFHTNSANPATADDGDHERMVITSTGQVGIGITNPNSYQSSSKDLVIGKTDNAAGITIRSGTNNGGYITFANAGSGSGLYKSRIAYDHQGDKLSFSTNGTPRLFILGNAATNGQIGVNTATPINDFTLLTDGNGYVDFHGSGGGGAEMNVYKKQDKSLTYKFANNGGANELAQHYLTNASGKYLWYIGGTSTANEKMRLDNNGRLGIGTASPSKMLTVRGTILKTRSDSGIGLIYLQQDGSQNGQIVVNQNGGVTRVQLHSAGYSYFNGGNVGIATLMPQSKLELDGRFRILDNSDGTPSSGKGLEISYYTSDDLADILSYDRGAGSYKKLQLRGSSIDLKKNNSILCTVGTGGNGTSVGFSTTVNLVTNAERIAVRGYSSFKSTNPAYAAIYLGSEGNTTDTANQLLMFNAGGANRGGIGYVPNTGELRFNHQYFMTFCTGSQLMGGTERFRIRSDGNIGIGDNVADANWKVKLVVSDSASYQNAFNVTNNQNSDFNVVIKSNVTAIGNGTNNPLVFFTNGNSNEAMRITSSGRVGINTTTDSMDGVTGNLNIANTNFNNHTVINLSRNTPSDRSQIRFQNTNGNIGSIDTFGSDLIVSSGNDLKLRTNGNERVIIASDGEILIPAAGANRLSMRHTSGGKFVIKNPTAANLSFGTNNNDEELVLENGGNFGISETNPQAKLHVRDDYDTETIILKLRNYKSGVNTKPSLRFEAVTSSGQGANSTIQGLAGTDAGGAANANDSGMKFNVAYGGAGTAREAFSLKRDGNIHFPNGQGINFGATAGGNASSGIFHDYEEGLWTPTVVAGIDGGAIFSIVRGWYIKVGDLVQISFFVRFVNSATGSTGNGNHFKMGGLPYSAANLSPAYSSGGVVTYTNCYFNNSNTIVFNIYNNTTQMEFHSARASAATLSGASNNRDIYAFGTYRSA